MDKFFEQIMMKLEHIERAQNHMKEDLQALKEAVATTQEKQKQMAISMQLNHEETMSEIDRINQNIKSIPATYEVNEKLLDEHASILSEHNTDIKLIKKMLTNQ
jgi:chromosome segregation ATPase